MGSWEECLRSVQFVAEMADGLIVDVRAEGVQSHRERFVYLIGNEIGFGAVELTHQSAGVLETMHLFASDLCHGALSAVGDQLDGVDEVLFFEP